MGQISNITVRASDGIKTADYAPPKLYDITAIIIPTDDDNVDQLLIDTLARINRAGQAYLTGRTPAKTVGEVAAETPAEEGPKPPRKRRTAAEIAADAALAKADKPKDDPAVEEDFQIEGETAEEDFQIEGETVDNGPEPITDAELNNVVQRKNADLKDPDAIKAVIKDFNPDPSQPFQLRQIAAGDRTSFVERINALKKAD